MLKLQILFTLPFFGERSVQILLLGAGLMAPEALVSTFEKGERNGNPKSK